MIWSRLIDSLRYGLEHIPDTSKAGTRTDFRRDYDRLVFSSPFRRLQNKTQVFPLPGSIFVHNRLTHSLEVSCVGRSLADEVGGLLRSRGLCTDPAELAAFEHAPDIVAAACLAHDLGNPPFGHSGEKAISSFFSEGSGRKFQSMLSPREWSDLVNFEGNANSFRTLVHRFRGRRDGGFAMTYSTLASIVKYPYESVLSANGKFGFFLTEREAYMKVAERLGIRRLSGDGEPLRYARHPLVYIVEAADDICYEVMDMEDAHKLKVLAFDEVHERFLAFLTDEGRRRAEKVMDAVPDPNERIAYLRSCVIGRLVNGCAVAFADNYKAIMDGTFNGCLSSAMDTLRNDAMKACSDLSWAKIYCAKDVVDVELAGNRIMTFLIEKLTDAVLTPDANYSRLLLSQVPEQYDVSAPTLYVKLQAVLDHISAMTDVYALDLYRKLLGMSLPAI